MIYPWNREEKHKKKKKKHCVLLGSIPLHDDEQR